MKLIIAGGRDFSNTKLMVEALNDLTYQENVEPKDLIIISGMARGADMLGYKLAKAQDMTVIECHAEWDKYGKSAGYRRNTEMADIATHCIAFWDGKSKGTKHMIDIMNKQNKPVFVVEY